MAAEGFTINALAVRGAKPDPLSDYLFHVIAGPGAFAEAAEECSASRVYLGIHFRYDSEAGTDLGRRVGALVVQRLLTRSPDGP